MQFKSLASLLVIGIPLIAGAQAPQLDPLNRTRPTRPVTEQFHGGDTVPPLYQGETSDIGPQKVLATKERKTLLEASVDAQFFYTDNMFFEEEDQQETSVLLSTAEAALAPTPYDLGPGRFGPRLGYRHQWYNFALPGSRRDLDEFDFNVQTFFTDLRYQLDDYILELGFEWNRLLSSHNYGQFYQDYGPTWSAIRLLPFTKTEVFSIGYSGQMRWADFDPELGLLPGVTNGMTTAAEDALDRVDHIFTVALTHAITQKLITQPYYRYKFTHFIGDLDRHDHLHTVGVSLNYFFTPWASVRGFFGYDWRESSLSSVPDYEKLDTGGGVNFTLLF